MTPENEVVALGIKLFNSSCSFVEKRIATTQNAISFIDSAWIISRSINEKHSLNEILEILNNLKATEESKPKSMSIFFNRRKYKLLAIILAQDIFASMQRRYRGQHEDSPSGTFTVVF